MFHAFFQFQQPAQLVKVLKCVFLNHGNPYLKLAPFKFEFLSFGPEVGYVHDFVSQTEIKEIKKDARRRETVICNVVT